MSTDSAMSLASACDEEMKKTTSHQGFVDDHLTSRSWCDTNLNQPVSVNRTNNEAAQGPSDTMAVHSTAHVPMQRSNPPMTRMYPQAATESLNSLDKFHGRFLNPFPLFGSGSDGVGGKILEHPLPLSFYYPQPENAASSLHVDLTPAMSKYIDNNQKNLCGGISNKRIDSIFMRQSNTETADRSEETAAEKQTENFDYSSERSVHSGSECEYPVSHTSRSVGHSCEESFPDVADEVISVADRIELELRKCFEKGIESNSDRTEIPGDVAVHSNKKNDVADGIEMERRKYLNKCRKSKTASSGDGAFEDIERASNSTLYPGNVLHEYQTFVRKAAMYASQRLVMELDDDNSVFRTVRAENDVDDMGKQKKQKRKLKKPKISVLKPEGKSKKPKTSRPDSTLLKDAEKQEKDGKSQKPETPVSKPGILTFTVERLFTFIIEEESNCEFTCKNCKMVFSNKGDAKSHVTIHSPFRCDSCDLTFTCLADMKGHYRLDHKETLHCNYCSYSSQLKADFERHVKFQHRANRITNIQMACYICGLCFPVWEPLDEHMEKEHGIKQGLMDGDFPCPLCNFISRSEKMFRDHIREHEGNYIECSHPGCGFRNVCPGRVNLHFKTVHEGRRKFSCPIEGCGARFRHGTDVDEHLNVVHYKIRKFFCETCGKRFLAKKHLSVHERIHSDIKPIGCRFCDYRCRQRASLKWHMEKSHPEMVSLEASFTSTTAASDATHQFKRGRKSTGKKEESAARPREGLVHENYRDVRHSKKRKICPELDSDGDGFLWSNIPHISDVIGQDQLGARAGTGPSFVPEYPRLYYPTLPGYPFPVSLSIRSHL